MIIKKLIVFCFTVFVLSGCGVVSHKRTEIVKNPEECAYSEKIPTAESLVRSRSPDNTFENDNDELVLVYHLDTNGEHSALHWSGYEVYVLLIPIPVLIPFGYHQSEYYFSKGKLKYCIYRGHHEQKVWGFPDFSGTKM